MHSRRGFTKNAKPVWTGSDSADIIGLVVVVVVVEFVYVVVVPWVFVKFVRFTPVEPYFGSTYVDIHMIHFAREVECWL